MEEVVIIQVLIQTGALPRQEILLIEQVLFITVKGQFSVTFKHTHTHLHAHIHTHSYTHTHTVAVTEL